VGFDPTAKTDDVTLSEIASRASSVQSFIAANKTSNGSDGDDSSCGPADGVPIWQWIPAIFCWMKSFLPPKISVGQCGGNAEAGLDSGSYSDSSSAAELSDNNENGVVDIAEKVGNGSVTLGVGQAIVPFGTTASLDATLLDAKNAVIEGDNYNTIHFDIRQVKAYSGAVSSDSSSIIYDRSGNADGLGNIQNIARYITFSPADILAQSGAATYNFSTLALNADVIFDAKVSQTDKNGKVLFTKYSNEITVRVRDIPQGLVAKIKDNSTAEYATAQSIEAGNPYGIMFELVSTDPAQREYGRLNIYDDVSGNRVAENLTVSAFPYFFRDTAVLNRA